MRNATGKAGCQMFIQRYYVDCQVRSHARLVADRTDIMSHIVTHEHSLTEVVGSRAQHSLQSTPHNGQRAERYTHYS